MKSVTTCRLILFALAFISSGTVFGQAGDERARAVALFHNSEFSEALTIFQKLAEQEPADALLRYFTGASMIEAGIFTGETEIYLLLAGSEDVPAKVFYYLGKFYHQKEDWDNAIRYYNRFKNNSSAEQTNEVELDQRIEEVYAQKKPGTLANLHQQPSETLFLNTKEEPPHDLFADSSSETSNPPMEAVNVSSSNDIEFFHPELIPSIQFQINAQITYWQVNQFKTEEARQAWERGKEKEMELAMLTDSLTRLRVDYHTTESALVRNQLASIIVPMERTTLITKAEAEKHFSQARTIESAWWINAKPDDIASLKAENEVLQQTNEAIMQRAVEQAFTIIEDETDENQQMHPEDELAESDDIVYKVQLGAFSGRVPARTQAVFDQMARVRPIETFRNDNNSTVYTTGNLRNFEDALALQNQIRIEGIKDAFVIALKEGKRISLPEAKILNDKE